MMIFSRMNSMKYLAERSHKWLYWFHKIISNCTEQFPIISKKEEEGLVASGNLDISDTFFTLYIATPVELALASLCPPLSPGGVASVTTQQVTSIYTLRVLKQKFIRFKNALSMIYNFKLTGLHSLPLVPRLPILTSYSQQSGEVTRQTRSVSW